MKVFREILSKRFAENKRTDKKTSRVNSRGNSKSSAKKNKQKLSFPTAPIARFLWFSVGILVILLTSLSFFLPIFKSATALDYFDYVSELRSNILLAETNEYSLKVYAVEKEYPYLADGIKRETSTRAEIYFSAPSGDKSCRMSFSINGKTYDSEASYDNVKAEYFLSEPVDLSDAKELTFSLSYGEENFTMIAKTVKTENTLTPRQVLNKLKQKDPATFESLTKDNAFVGEIYLRLISENAPYYYIGLIEKSGNIKAYLLHSETGKILAKREHQ